MAKVIPRSNIRNNLLLLRNQSKPSVKISTVPVRTKKYRTDVLINEQVILYGRSRDYAKKIATLTVAVSNGPK